MARRPLHLPAAPPGGDRASRASNWFKGRPEAYDAEANFDLIRRYCESLENARQNYDGITVRYEELTENPDEVTHEICEFLGVDWEPSMLDYGKQDHGRYKSGLGDWSENIKSGEVQKAKPPPPETPEPLRPIAAKWGYLTEETPAVRRVLKLPEELVPHRADRVHLEVAPGLARRRAAAVT